MQMHGHGYHVTSVEESHTWTNLKSKLLQYQPPIVQVVTQPRILEIFGLMIPALVNCYLHVRGTGNLHKIRPEVKT